MWERGGGWRGGVRLADLFQPLLDVAGRGPASVAARHQETHRAEDRHTPSSSAPVRENAYVYLASQLRRRMNIELNSPPNSEGLVLGCIDADFASKYSLESSRRDLHNALLCTVL